MGRILAIDYGHKRTGLAVTDPLRITANPLLTLPTQELMTWLDEYMKNNEVDEVVIGHPTQLNGEESSSMQYIRPFARQFRQKFPQTPLREYDERFTSTLAHQAMIMGGMKKQQRRDKAVVDKIAATIILEYYLESQRNEGRLV